MKKFLIISSIIICSILLFINFYQYLFVFEVNAEFKQRLFENCAASIDTKNLPMTSKEWRKLADKREVELIKLYNMPPPKNKITPNYAYDILKNGEDDQKKIVELAISLGDKVDETHKQSFFDNVIGSNKLDNYQAYYDYTGHLLFFEKSAAPNSNGICRYNNKGKLIELAYRDFELYYVFTPQGHLMYRCYWGSCENDLIKYKKPKL